MVVTEVRSESFGLVSERRHYNACPIYVNSSRVGHVLFFIVECGIARFLCACARYARIRRSGIIITPRLPVCQISPSITELARGE